MLGAYLICAIVAAGPLPRYIVVPDPHEFVHGFTLQPGERLVLAPCGHILRPDGFPDETKIEALLK